MDWHRIPRGPKLRFYLALGFLLWAVMPHFSLTIHAHQGDGPEHGHSILDRAQLSLAENLSEAATVSYGASAVQAEFGLAEFGLFIHATPDQPAFAASGLRYHGHYQEDANAVATYLFPNHKTHLPAPAIASASLPVAPLNPSFLENPARGPPYAPA